MVSYLLEKGADPNVKAQCGATVLHFAAECGQLSIVKELLAYGAEFSLNEAGLFPQYRLSSLHAYDFRMSNP